MIRLRSPSPPAGLALGSRTTATDTLGSTDIGVNADGTSELASSIPAARVTSTSGQPSHTPPTRSSHLQLRALRHREHALEHIQHLPAHGPGDGHLRGERQRPVVDQLHDRSQHPKAEEDGTDSWRGGAGNDANSVSTMARLVAGDYIEVAVSHLSGGSKTIGSLPEYSPEFSMTWLARGP